MSNYIVIPARLKSERLPSKLLMSDTGHPLIWHTVQNAKQSRLAKSIIVATDSESIKDAVKDEVEVVMTGDCTSGTQRIAEACTKLKLQGTIVNIQGDEPVVDMDCVDELFEALDLCTTKKLERRWDVATLATPASYTEYNDPNVVKVVTGNCENAIYFSRSPIPYGGSDNSLKHIGVYAYNSAFLYKMWMMDVPTNASENLEQLQWIENGKNIRVLVREMTGTGIDTQVEYDMFVSDYLGVDLPTSERFKVSYDWRNGG